MTTARSLVKHTLTERHLKAIGLVSAEWSWTELCLEQLVWEVAQMDSPIGQVFTAHSSADARLNMLLTLSHLMQVDPDAQADLLTLAGRMKELKEQRNRVVHALWMSPRPATGGLISSAMKRRRKPVPLSFRVIARRKVVFSTKPIPAKEIEEVAQRIAHLSHDMMALRERLNERRNKVSPWQ